MSYVDKNLLTGETVKFRTRLHWSLYVPSVLLTLLVMVPAAVLLVINLLAIDRWQPEIFVYPVYAFVITGLIWGTLFRARMAARGSAHAA